MTELIEWTRGPLFRASFTILIIGLLRLLFLNLYALGYLIWEARKNGREVPYTQIAKVTLEWLIPLRKAREERIFFNLVSILFHVTIIITPLFLGTHILLWQRALGISWPALGALTADILTFAAIVTGLILFFDRLLFSASRGLSRFQDYFLPLFIIVPFVSGFLVMHPGLNPLSYDWMMLIHVLSGNLILVLIPFSKISHVALFPISQMISELGWFLEPTSGVKVATALGKEKESL